MSGSSSQQNRVATQTTETRMAEATSMFSMEHLQAILAWKNSVKTSVILTALNVVFVLFLLSRFTLLSLLFFAGFVSIMAGYLVSCVIQSKPAAEQKVELITKSSVETASTLVYDHVNYMENDISTSVCLIATQCRAIMLWYDPARSLQVWLCMGFMSYIASYMSTAMFFYLGMNALFFTDQLRYYYDKVISKYVDMAMVQLRKKLGKVPKSQAPSSSSGSKKLN